MQSRNDLGFDLLVIGKIIMVNPLPNHGVNLPDDEQEGELPPPPADSDTSSDSEPEVEAKVEDGDEATIGTITRAPYSVPPFSDFRYSDGFECFQAITIGRYEHIIMENPLPNHGVNLLDDEQVQPELIPALHGFALAVLDIPNNNNRWIEEEPEEDPEIKEEEEEE
nr:hypothetical protein [Tanacetum cinerariifolium]